MLLVVLGACGRIGFDPGGLATGDDGAGGGDGGPPGGDGSLVDGPGGSCIAPGNGCAFPGGLPCSCFGTPSMINAGMAENAANHLRITPNANTLGAQGSCVRTATPFGPGGAIVEIAQVVSGAEGLTAIQVGGGADVFTLSQRGGQLIAEDGGGTVNAIPYFAFLMRWWRMRPNGLGVVFEYATNGMTWTTFAQSTRTPSTTYTVRLIGGTLAAIAAPGFAQFNRVNLCGP